MTRWIVLATSLASLACGAESGGDFENTVPNGYEEGTRSPENKPTQNENWNGSDGVESCETLQDPCLICICVAGSEAAAVDECLEECSF